MTQSGDDRTDERGESYTSDNRWTFSDPDQAVSRLIDIYDRNTEYLRKNYLKFSYGEGGEEKIRACYPEIRFYLEKLTDISPLLSYGFLENTGYYAASITQPRLFADYLREQIGLIIKHHHIPVEIGVSAIPIPIKFVSGYDDIPIDGLTQERIVALRHLFSTVDLDVIDDGIADGVTEKLPSGAYPLSLFNAPRIDIALQRLEHYTGCRAEDFQNFILFTNYAFHMEYFLQFALHNLGFGRLSGIPSSIYSYEALVIPGLRLQKGQHDIDIGLAADGDPENLLRHCTACQMPAFHLQRPGRQGISIVNIGVGPSNAKTMTDCLSVLRPHCWLMVGHCAGLDGRMQIGDMIVANSFERQDLILDRHVPLNRPIPGLSEVQLALEQACRKIGKIEDITAKPENLRTGTVLTVADRNGEWRTTSEIRRDLQGSTSIALDMETATIATNGYRFRVPYGALLSVSDKPLHNEPKLPQAARNFYRASRAGHILASIDALEAMMARPAVLHSRKLRRAQSEVAFR